MKKLLRIVPLLLMAVCAVVATSCLGDDDDNNREISDLDRQHAFQITQGPYEGYAIFYDRNYGNGRPTVSPNGVDTLDAKWNVSRDTLLTITELPAAALAHQMQEGSIADAVEKAGNVEIACNTWYYSLDPPAFLVSPHNVDLTVEYEGGTHHLRFLFLTDANSSYGFYSSSDDTFVMRLRLYGLYVDGTDASDLLVRGNYHSQIAFLGHQVRG